MIERSRWSVMPLFLAMLSIPMMGSSHHLNQKEKLGKKIYFDEISSNNNMSCASCHDPKAGWTSPDVQMNIHGGVHSGSVASRFGNRKPPSAAYASTSPIFHYDCEDETFVGGNFWDGRATGEDLGNPASEQALGPFVNPVEQNVNKVDVLKHIANSKYASLWKKVWGEPISFEPEDIEKNYNRVGLAIGSFEASSEVNQFSSKYDEYLRGNVKLTDAEKRGLELFNDPKKGNCAACHPSEIDKDGNFPLFTDYTYDNLGVPKNPENPFYKMNEVDLDDGTPINYEGKNWVDIGLAGFLQTRDEWNCLASENIGKQKVPTLRNIDKRPNKHFKKSYTHNGYFTSLKSIVHFYNTRDIKDTCKDPFTTDTEAMKLDCWPEAEVEDNVNREELGNLNLTDQEEDDIVSFLSTLSDGYRK